MAQSRFIEHLAAQFGEAGLFTVAVHPGAVATPSALQNTPDEFLPRMSDMPAEEV